MGEIINKIKAVVIGHAVGDALGVPVEFCEREELAKNPVTDMRGFGSYPVPAGALFGNAYPCGFRGVNGSIAFGAKE